MPELFTTRDVAELFGVEPWRIQRLFESGSLVEPARFAGKRVITGRQLPAIVEALRARDWLPTSNSDSRCPGQPCTQTKRVRRA